MIGRVILLIGVVLVCLLALACDDTVARLFGGATALLALALVVSNPE